MDRASSTPSRRTVRVVAALIEHDGQLLVQRRPPGGARALLWEFPGGKVEPGETDAEALVRECQEELGVSIVVGPAMWQTQHDYADLSVALYVYRAHLVDGSEPTAREAQELAWWPLATLESLAFCPADEPLVADLVEGRLRL